jgi:hypothetical protein
VNRDEFVRRFDFALRDLPWRTQRELVSDLESHLAELPADVDLHERLGSPEQYAADMRDAAGLDRRRGPIAFIRARRPRNIAIAVVTLTIACLAIGAVVWINGYQPLEQGNGSTDPGGKILTGLDGVQATFRPGRPFALGITVVNSGRFTVRILGVPWTEGSPWTAHLMMSPAQKNTGGMVGPYVRFHPVDLPPGDVIFLFFKGVYACHAPESRRMALVYTDFPVRYSFLWRTTTVSIPLREPVAIYFPKGCK